MIYEIKYDPKAEEQLDKLPKEIPKRVVNKMRQVGETGRGIEGIKDKKYGGKVRVGDYRILVDRINNPSIIFVRVVGHRKNIYKNI